MRKLAFALLLLVLPAALSAQSAADSALVRRILLAEDRRDANDAALGEGARSANAAVRVIARRARGRIIDPKFAARDSLPPLEPPTIWPEAAWRLRFRALTNKSDCDALKIALADSAWPVRFRAMDLVTKSCAGDDQIATTLRAWVNGLPADASRRAPGGVSWHAAAHALVALARMRPDEARTRMNRVASNRQWQARAYAARAAAILADTARLRVLAHDPDDNVKDAAIGALSKLVGHTDDALYLSTLNARGAQAVRAAAVALKGSPRPDVTAAANAAFGRWVALGIASARDVRVALLEAAGRPVSDDKRPAITADALPQLVALALGADIRLRVTIAPTSGGGSFVVRLRGDVAPLMASRILALARAGYYDNLTWHRVEHDFVIQGGSPGASEYIGLSEYMRDEVGTVPHLRGTVGMSTRGHDSGDAQWFVNLRDNLRLNGDYTVFGDVIEGIDVVDGIIEGDVIASIAELRH